MPKTSNFNKKVQEEETLAQFVSLRRRVVASFSFLFFGQKKERKVEMAGKTVAFPPH
jgi:hypothetical protein